MNNLFTFFISKKQKFYMVAGELYKKFKTHTGRSCYLLPQKTLTSKMTFGTGHMTASWTRHIPREGGEVASPL